MRPLLQIMPDNASLSETFGGNRKRYSIRLYHDGCWMIDTTATHPGLHVIERSFYHGDEEIKTDIIAYIEDEYQDLTGIESAIETIRQHDDVNSVEVIGRVGERVRLMIYYNDNHSINTTIANSDIMPIEPVRATDGIEHWSVLSDPGKIGSILHELEESWDADIESIRGFDPNSDMVFTDIVDQINDQLSPRQIQSIFTADDAGYYSWPRDKSANEIADQMDVTGPTFLEHVRKGEQKIIKAVINELQVRHGRTGD